MRYLLKITILVSVSVFLLISCDKEKEELPEPVKPETYSYEDFTLPNSTIIIHKNTLDDIENISKTDTTITIRNSAQIDSVEVGDIIVFGVSDNTPLGLMRKVVKVESSASETKLITTFASLEEAIKECDIDEEIDLTKNEFTFTNLADGVSVASNSGGRTSEGNLYLEVDVTLKEWALPNNTNVKGKVSIKGEISIRPTVLINRLRIEEYQRKLWNIKVGFANENNLTVSISDEIELKSGDFYLGTIWAAPIPVGVLVLTPSINFYCGIDGSIRAAITSSISLKNDVEVGFNATTKAEQIDPTFTWDSDNEISPINASVTISAEPYFKPAPAIWVYAIPVELSGIRAYANLEVDPFGPVCFTASAGLKFKPDIRGKILGKKIEFKTELEFGYENIIYKSDGPCFGGQENELIAYYPFNENANDETGNGHDGIVNGATPSTDRFDNPNGAFSFDGIDDWINLGAISQDNKSKSWAFWAKSDKSKTNYNESMHLIGNPNQQLSSNTGLYLQVPKGSSVPSRDYKVNLGAGSGTIAVIDNEEIDNLWHFYTAIYDETKLHLYKDAALIGSVALQLDATDKDLGVGMLTFNNKQFFEGKIDDIRIYNYAIDQNEIDNLYGEDGWAGNPVVVPDLVAYYPFNNNANDESGNGHDGTVNGATPTTDRFGNANSAYSFDGVNDFINVKHDPIFNIKEDFTISAWAISDNTVNKNNYVVSKGENELYNHEYLLYFTNLDNHPRFNLKGNNNYVGSTASADKDKWVHLAAIKNGTDFYLYVDGVKHQKTNLTLPIDSQEDINIGKMVNSFFTGKIDDIRIYNYAIDELTVNELFTENGWTGNPPNVPDLVAFYPFNNNANDESGNSNHGTVNGASPTTDRFGNANSAYSFDGQNDFISVQHVEELVPRTDDFSMSAWFSTTSTSFQTIAGKTNNDGTRAFYTMYVNNLEWGLYTGSELGTTQGSHGLGNSEINVSDGNWHHLVMTREATSTSNYLHLYLDGQLIEISEDPFVLDVNPKEKFYIGALKSWNFGTFSQFFDGKLDDIRYYNYLLSDVEISYLYSENGWTGSTSNIQFNPNLTYGLVSDIDGNNYKTIQIGEQIWMAENLATTSYNDGTPITNISGDAAWYNSTSPAYCWYGNDKFNYRPNHGALYNWFAVNTNKLCPVGWHVPSDDEWKSLELYLGMDATEVEDGGIRGIHEGGTLKEIGTQHWETPNVDATNESGFTAVPSGLRDYVNGGFEAISENVTYWTSTQINPFPTPTAMVRDLTYWDGGIYRDHINAIKGHSVRCIKD